MRTHSLYIAVLFTYDVKLVTNIFKVYLILWQASKKRTSKQAKKSFDPVYNETLVYHGISEDDILTKGLRWFLCPCISADIKTCSVSAIWYWNKESSPNFTSNIKFI